MSTEYAEESRDDVLDGFGSLDVLAPNSSSEGLPNVILEAMTLGMTVVAASVGGVLELVEDGATGLSFSPGERINSSGNSG